MNILVHGALQPRVKRWSDTPEQCKVDTIRVLSILFSSKDALPPCARFGFVQSICYGWMTDVRFRNLPPRPCVFGCGEGRDCFYHYACCPVLWKAAYRLGLSATPSAAGSARMLLVLIGEEHVHLRVVFLHSCMISVHKLRGPHSHIAGDERERYIRDNFSSIVTRSATLKSSFNCLWRIRGVPRAMS